jgi:fibrillarin-like pre-rRNA processing protein
MDGQSEKVKWLESNPYTRNMVPGQSVYWEVLRRVGGIEYRFWDPRRSKLAAFLKCRGKTFPFEATSSVLYLGAASGTTVSHISDILTGGRIFCVEIARNPFRELLALAEKRPNMIPILEDANQPHIYERLVGQADILYQDIAQRNQTEIFIKNSKMLKPQGIGFLMVKARCIDVTAPPMKTYEKCTKELAQSGFDIEEVIRLEPFEKDHAAVVVRKR